MFDVRWRCGRGVRGGGWKGRKNGEGKSGVIYLSDWHSGIMQITTKRKFSHNYINRGA